MDDLAQYEVESALGCAKVVINGEDVSDRVNSVQITHHARQLPEVILGLVPGAAHFTGKGVVYVNMGPDPVQEISNFLDGLDVKALEDRALASMGWGDGSLGASLIKAIKEEYLAYRPESGQAVH